jgi:type I restriction enzyme R subunit
MADNQNPEQIARDHIDELLKQAGWKVQSLKKIDLNDGPGQAVREYQTDVGPADYVLFVNKKAVGVFDDSKVKANKLFQYEVTKLRYEQVKLP